MDGNEEAGVGEGKEEREKEEDRDGAGAWLLGATAMHSKKEADAEEDCRRKLLGSRRCIQGFKGLGVRVAHVARTPGDLGMGVKTLVGALQWLI